MTVNKVVWINLQGADWDVMRPLLQAGKMPNLARLIDRGASGQLFAIPPRRYPSALVSLASGVAPEQHTVVGAVVADETESHGLRPVGSSDWAHPAVWEMAARAGVSTAAIGWPATHPTATAPNALTISDVFLLADGNSLADWACDPASVSDPAALDDLASLRMHPQDITGKMLAPLLAATDTIDLHHDERLSCLIESMARALTLHRVANWVLTHRTPRFLAIHFDFIEQLSQAFLQYQAPRMGHVTNADHARYATVVSGAYTYFDQMLLRYVEATGDAGNVVVTSDHGYASGTLRKRPAEVQQGRAHKAYREAAVFCAAGPAFTKGAKVSGAKTTAVARTLLAALNVKAPASLEDAGMAQVLAGSVAPQLDVSAGVTPKASAVVTDATSNRILAFLGRRGFLPGLPNDRESIIEILKSTTLTRLAQCNMAAQNNAVALAQLAEARELAPGMVEAYVLTAQCGVAEQAWDTVEEALDTLDNLGAEVLMADYWRARVALASGDEDTAKDYLAAAVAAAEDTLEGSRLLESVGTAFLNMKAVAQAEDAFRRALAISPNGARASNGLGSVHLMAKDYAQALACFQTSLAALDHQPKIHALRGFALLGLGQHTAARTAFERALTQDRSLALARQGLLQLHQQAAP